MVMKSDPQYANSSQLDELEDRVKCGASGVLAAQVKDRLYVASIGDCRALLYRSVHSVISRYSVLIAGL